MKPRANAPATVNRRWLGFGGLAKTQTKTMEQRYATAWVCSAARLKFTPVTPGSKNCTFGRST